MRDAGTLAGMMVVGEVFGKNIKKPGLKVWSWPIQGAPVGCDEKHKAAARKRRQKKHARKARRGY